VIVFEPYYESYLSWNVGEAFESAGLKKQSETPTFLSKVAAFTNAP